jgi:hypothetical protein
MRVCRQVGGGGITGWYRKGLFLDFKVYVCVCVIV